MRNWLIAFLIVVPIASASELRLGDIAGSASTSMATPDKTNAPAFWINTGTYSDPAPTLLYKFTGAATKTYMLEMYPTNVFWVDSFAPAMTFNTVGTTAAWSSNKCGYTFQKGDAGQFNMQLQHDAMMTNEIHVHVHFSKDIGNDATANTNLHWNLDYKIGAIGTAFPASWTKLVLSNGVDQVAGNTNVDIHHLHEFSTINVTNIGPSPYLLFRLTRINDGSDTYVGNVTVYGADAHYQRRLKPGSISETSMP